MGIGCTWCAYCVDEAFVIRVTQMEEAEDRARQMEDELKARRAAVGSKT